MKRAVVAYRLDRKLGPYADAVRAAGVDPLPVKPGEPLPSLDRIDGLVLTGGSDLNPALYGQPRDPRSDDPDDERDALEASLLRDALARDLPVLAICRGHQLFNVVHPGGTLAQHIDGHDNGNGDAGAPAHTVQIDPASRLASILGATEAPVNSRHHQAVQNLGAGLTVSARAPDGVVEAIERPGLRFAVAVQWHPEDQARSSAQQRRLFEAFKDAL